MQKKKKKENKEEYLEKQRLQKREQRLIQRTKNKEECQEKERQSRQKTRLNQRSENEDKYRAKERDSRQKLRLKETDDQQKRSKKFKESIKDGRIFECVCCHRICFKNGVYEVPENFEDVTKKTHPDLFENSIGYCFETRPIRGKFFICVTCHSYINKGKIPPMSNQN